MAPTAFARVLDEGLSARGMPLDRVVEHVARRGQRCSASTLSLWRRGRTRPSEARSGAVLGVLEEILRLRPDTLREALAQPDVETPEWWGQRVPIHERDDVQQALHDFRVTTGLDHQDDLERLRVHTKVEIGRDRTVDRIQHSAVLRAQRDDARRIGVYHYTDEMTPDGQPSVFELGPTIGGHPVQVAEFGQLGASAAVIELDRPLARGEMTQLVIEWVRVTEAPSATTQGEDFYEVRSPWPVRHLGIEACFLGDPPTGARGWSVQEAEGTARLGELPSFEMAPSHCLQVAADDVVGGGVRLAWSWGPPDD